MAHLAERVALLETRQDMEERLNAARDSDLSNLVVKVDSHTRMLQALQERQAEQSLMLGSLDRRVESLDHKVESLDHKVESLDHKVESLDHKVESLRQMTTDGFAAIGGQLQLIIERVDGQDRH